MTLGTAKLRAESPSTDSRSKLLVFVHSSSVAGVGSTVKGVRQ